MSQELKKRYIIPNVGVVELISNSPVNGNGPCYATIRGIGYGNVGEWKDERELKDEKEWEKVVVIAAEHAILQGLEYERRSLERELSQVLASLEEIKQTRDSNGGRWLKKYETDISKSDTLGRK